MSRLSLRSLLRSDDGIALAYFAIALPALLGMAVLIVDIARGNNLHLDLQNAADGLALAAAAELDGGDDAIERANRAIATLVGNQARFGDGGGFIVDQVTVAGTPGQLRVFFLHELPPSDDDLIDAGYVTTDPADAHFAAVYIEPVNYSLLFPLDFFAETTIPVAATAVAGFRSVVCDFTPMYICNPYDGYQELENAVQNLGTRRRQFEMRQAPGNPMDAGPGQYGFLQSPLGNGASEIRDMLARDDPHACFSQDGVELESGQLGAAASDAANVRFDIYRASMNSNKGQEHFQPANNVRKGFGSAPPNCPSEPSPAGLGRMPRDNCFSAGNCTLLGGHGGNGEWSCGTYWANNHSAAAPVGCDDTPDNALPSRYDIYMYEIDHNFVADQAPNNETGTPTCYTGTSTKTADRRLLVAAILDCPVTQQPAKPVAYASFFLTEPAGYGANSSFWGELVDITGRFGNGTLESFERDDVQLYR